ncbi:alpha-galactosidase [Paenibacillus selenitireducens]|uniref:Alpha-galactosidase n=1 Tax=Paenibacillus selenitireducens TaxID=1324314 RepID=A0A1T2XA17_9BACL|nr:alpha-galactosidase [Paenibacillus selenitireducens]OPA76675.1 alpha-galactosidase [Paenibacillus selenitireducens]
MLQEKHAQINVVTSSEEVIQLDNGLIQLRVDLRTGEASYHGKQGFEMNGIVSAVRWMGKELHSNQYQQHGLHGEFVQIEDEFGQGVQIAIRHEASLWPAMIQYMTIYEHQPFVLLRTDVTSQDVIKVNRISVLKAASLQVPAKAKVDADPLHVLQVPFDNDKWVRYSANPLPLEIESYEVSAIFRNENRHGLVLGSLTHDVWKTGIQVHGKQADGIDALDVYGGASSTFTRDSLPHGYVSGRTIKSPLVFLGFYEDYREGLEAYGRANAKVTPALPWESGVPFGWNSWSAAADKLDYDLYTSTSNFLKQEVQAEGFQNEGTLYINFDSFWTNLSEDQMQDAVQLVRRNGHKPGTYWTPFTFWGGVAQFDDEVEGTNGKYTYRDILLKDWQGEVLPDLDGGLAIDPTHPGTLERIDWYTDKFITEGFEYIKLDFMAHGALEGVHHNPIITTGIAAYHFGMSYLTSKLSPERVGKPFFINLSIAPLFPAHFAHSRRVSCDAFGTIADTEYMLNSVTYGWWINDTVYRFNDPDHSVLYKSYNQDATTRHEGRSRLTGSVIAGTVLLMGDDFREEEAAWRAKAWLTNKDIINVARIGKTFVPVEGNNGSGAADVFVQSDADGDVYVAVFNYDGSCEVEKNIDLARLGLDAAAGYRVHDLWDGSESEASGSWNVKLHPAESKIYRLKQMEQ